MMKELMRRLPPIRLNEMEWERIEEIMTGISCSRKDDEPTEATFKGREVITISYFNYEEPTQDCPGGWDHDEETRDIRDLDVDQDLMRFFLEKGMEKDIIIEFSQAALNL